MNIIEQATRRLEELRRSGVDIAQPETARKGNNSAGLVDKNRANGERARYIGDHRSAADARAASAANQVPHGAAQPAESSKLVEIDLARLAAMGYVTPDSPRAQIAGELRVIKRPLLTNVQGKSAAPIERANLIMVTSSVPGEGKTFLAVNLAISMAMEMDGRVLLIDADVSRPAVLNRLGLPQSPGLLDVLTNPELRMSDVMLRTNIERLSIVPAGAPQGHATELLASEGMGALLDELASRYSDRVLIFDAPPLLPSTESRVLAAKMGQVVVVVEAEHTPQSTVAQAMQTLEACPVVLPVLNKTSRSDVGTYYGYYGPGQS